MFYSQNATVTSSPSASASTTRTPRARWLWLLVLLAGSAAAAAAKATNAADYMLEGDDYATYDGAANADSGAGAGVGVGSNGGDEEAFEAALLQQAIEAQRLSNMDRLAADELVEAVTAPAPAQQRPPHHLATPPHHNNTLKHAAQSEEADEDYDEVDRLHLSKKQQQHQKLPTIDSSSSSSVVTTEVPTYVRKAIRSDQVPQASSKTADLATDDANSSDYTHDDDGGEGEGKEPQDEPDGKAKGVPPKSAPGVAERVPFAMKFYHGKTNVAAAASNNNNNNNNEQAKRTENEPNALPQPQPLLPGNAKARGGNAATAAEPEDEDYYTDSQEAQDTAKATAGSTQNGERQQSSRKDDVDEEEEEDAEALIMSTSAPALPQVDKANLAGFALPFSNALRSAAAADGTTTPAAAAAMPAVATTTIEPTTTILPITTTTTATTATALNANGINYRAGKDITTSVYNNNNNNNNIISTTAEALPPDWPATSTATTTIAMPPSTVSTTMPMPVETTTTTATPTTSERAPNNNNNNNNSPTTPASSSATTPASLATSAATTTTTATTERPASGIGGGAGGGGGKQGKQINISRRKLLAHEQLRNYIEDAYIRMPLAVIVDPTSGQSLEKTKALWHDALRTNYNIKIVLVSLNASGIPAAFNFNNTRQFLAGLNGIKEHDGGDAFIGIVHASELVPYDSAVFISTAIIPPHTELVQDAAITLLKKRIRLYVIWYGERAVSENETQDAVGGILGEVAIRSGGEILHIVGSENAQELEGSTLTLVADAFRGSQEVDVPVDTTLSNLHVKIDEPMRIATMETPNGVINLKKMVKFKSRVLTGGADDKRLDAYVPLNKLRKASVYRLRMVPEAPDVEYSVFVRADRKADVFLDDMIKRFDSYFLEGFSSYTARLSNSILHSITAGSLPNTHADLRVRFPEGPRDGDDIDGGKVAFNNNDEHSTNDLESNNAGVAIEGGSQRPKEQVETFSETEIHIDAPPKAALEPSTVGSVTSTALSSSTSTTPTTTTTTTRPLAASAIVNQQRAMTNMFTSAVTKIEMGANTQLLVAPGMMAQLYFELTNTRAQTVFHNIQVVDERRFLLRLLPQSIYLRPDEKAVVTVTVLVPSNTAQGTIDKITFTLHGGAGGETASLPLQLKVTNSIDAQDTTPPSISWTFGNRCDGIASDNSNCAERFWTMDVRAQDWETGLLRLQATPPGGLITRNTPTIGTSESLKATYVASCCEPKVTLLAFDLAGNQRSYSVDVRSLYLTEAAIAAIVLGVLLLIVLIILIAWATVWCCRRRKVSLDLPTYRSHSTRSME